MSDFWDCWCGHTARVHHQSGCGLCVGSPLLRSEHRVRAFAELPPIRDYYTAGSLRAQLASGHIRLRIG